MQMRLPRRTVHSISLLLLLPAATSAVAVTICNGGACSVSGAARLLETATILSADDDAVCVEPMSCCSVCPRGKAVVVNNGAGNYAAPANNDAEMIASATELLNREPDPALLAAVGALNEARAASKSNEKASKFTAVLSSPTVQSLLEQRGHSDLEPESFEWEATTWNVREEVSAWDGPRVTTTPLELSDSTANFEFGTCGDIVLMDCVSDEEEPPTLSGIYEDGASGSGGEFSFAMSEDGRRFDGSLNDDDGSVREWSGLRQGAGGSRDEAPPPRLACCMRRSSAAESAVSRVERRRRRSKTRGRRRRYAAEARAAGSCARRRRRRRARQRRRRRHARSVSGWNLPKTTNNTRTHDPSL